MELEYLADEERYIKSPDNDECFDIEGRTYSPLVANLYEGRTMVHSHEGWMNLHAELEVYRELQTKVWEDKKGKLTF